MPPVRTLARTITLSVWNQDYPLLLHGLKCEYRQAGPFANSRTQVEQAIYPAPTLMWTINHAGVLESALMVTERGWRERLLSISEESIRSEGFESVADFKHYWLLRTGQRPKLMTWVYARRLRHWAPGDSEFFSHRLMRDLYGSAFDEAHAATTPS